MTGLTDLQLVLLSTASQRDDGSLLPPPAIVGERSPATDKAIQLLVRRGLAAELDTSDVVGGPSQDRDRLVGVRITASGRAAIGLADNSDEQTHETLAPAPALTEKKDTKASQVLALLHRDNGAALNELVAATGWLPHTTRAALTGLRKKGHELESEKIDGVRRYRIAAKEMRTAAAR